MRINKLLPRRRRQISLSFLLITHHHTSCLNNNTIQYNNNNNCVPWTTLMNLFLHCPVCRVHQERMVRTGTELGFHRWPLCFGCRKLTGLLCCCTTIRFLSLSSLQMWSWALDVTTTVGISSFLRWAKHSNTWNVAVVDRQVRSGAVHAVHVVHV